MNIDISSRSDMGSLMVVFIPILLGGACLVLALMRLKLRRHIENTPTSKIKSAAINELIELQCQVISDPAHHLNSPLSNILCNSYLWIFERQVKNKKKKKWKLMFKFFSQNFLLVEDEDDPLSQAAVRLDQSRIENIKAHKVTYFNDHSFDLPEEVLKVIKTCELFDIEKKSSFLFSKKYRLKEYLLRPEDKLFIIGTTYSPSSLEGKTLVETKKLRFGRNDEIKVTHSKWKNFLKDKKVLKYFDKDGDGLINEEEEKEVIKKLDEKYKKYAPKVESKYDFTKIKIVMGKSKARTQLFDDPDVFISGISEKKLSFRLLLQGMLFVLIGAGMTTYGIYHGFNLFM